VTGPEADDQCVRQRNGEPLDQAAASPPPAAAHPRQSSGQREWRAARRLLGDHLGHELVRAALDALGAGDDRRALGELRRVTSAASRRCCDGTANRIAS
jgi:hypothetical protein